MRKIQYYLRKNNLSRNENDGYTACTPRKETLYQDDLVNIMLGKNSTVTRQDIIVVLDLLKESVTEQIQSGFSLNTDLFKAAVTVRGTFRTPGEAFDPDHHQLHLYMNPSTSLKKALAGKTQVEAVPPKQAVPVISRIVDLTGGSFADALSAGSLIEVKGRDLKTKGLETRLILSQEGEKGFIPVTQVFRSTDRRILCQLPEELLPGEYGLTVILGEGSEAPRGTWESRLSIS